MPVSLLFGASCLLPDRSSHFESAAGSVAVAAGPDLTDAERRVLGYVLAGWANKEIAAELGRSELTVKNHVAALLRKHGVPSRARLIALLR